MKKKLSNNIINTIDGSLCEHTTLQSQETVTDHLKNKQLLNLLSLYGTIEEQIHTYYRNRLNVHKQDTSPLKYVQQSKKHWA